MSFLRVLLLLAACLGLNPALAADAPPRCDSCEVRVDSLDEPIGLAGYWLFTREDRPQNKDVVLDTSDWKLAKAPGPWKKIYGDGKNFTVGWYRGTLVFDPKLIGQEVVLLVNTYMARMHVYVDGREMYQRPHDINVERYYSIQPVPVRFKVTQQRHVVAFRVDTPLMTGVYQLPLELRRYDQHDATLAIWQVTGGEARTIAAYSLFIFGAFFLLVYAKTKYPLYLTAALGAMLIFPFFGAPGDYFMKVFEPETMLYLHYLGISGVFMFYMFGQYITHEFTPRLNWIFGGLYAVLIAVMASMLVAPNLGVFQVARPLLFIVSLLSGALGTFQLLRAAVRRCPGALVLGLAESVFLILGANDVLLALGLIESVSMIFYGCLVFVCTMSYVSAVRFADTFVENKKLVKDLKQVNDNLEDLVAERTQQLREKTQDIQSMLQNMPQGVLTITANNQIHPEYSAYLETIFETRDIAGRNVMELVFAGSSLGADLLSQVEVAAGACVGEDRMNFEFNSHLMVRELDKTLPDGRVKSLELSWSPICDEHDTIEKLMLCVRDVTELKRLEHEAKEQKRELEIIGEILAVSQEKFHEFCDSARGFIEDNRRLVGQADGKSLDTVNLLFRNMHTIKGNARTYGLLYLTNLVHEAEQAYDELRKNEAAEWQPERLLGHLDQVQTMLDEYTKINDTVLGRKGPGRRGSVEKFVMVERDQVQQSLQLLAHVDPSDHAALRNALSQVGRTLNLIGTQSLAEVLDGPLSALPSLAQELGKEAPRVRIEDHGILVRSQIGGLLKNLFTHLLRNAMDHGLEPGEERLAQGKPAQGRIDIDVSVDDGRLWLRLRDDGRGMAVARIRQSAIDKGLLAADAQPTPEQVAQFIFMSGFSTAERVTEVSGRGVGMDAVRGFLNQEGGDIAVRFLDENPQADFRAFELVIHLPDKYAASLDAAMSFDALRARALSARVAAAAH